MTKLAILQMKQRIAELEIQRDQAMQLLRDLPIYICGDSKHEITFLQKVNNFVASIDEMSKVSLPFGSRIRMSEEFKLALRNNNCSEHVEEFGDCLGVVIGLTDYGTHQGPEVDVRWQPSGLRYAYHPKFLVAQD